MFEHTTQTEPSQASADQSQVLADLCYRFVRPFLQELDQHVDRRFVQILLDMLQMNGTAEPGFPGSAGSLAFGVEPIVVGLPPCHPPKIKFGVSYVCFTCKTTFF